MFEFLGLANAVRCVLVVAVVATAIRHMPARSLRHKIAAATFIALLVLNLLAPRDPASGEVIVPTDTLMNLSVIGFGLFVAVGVFHRVSERLTRFR